MGILDLIRENKPLKERKRFDYAELKDTIKQLKTAGVVNIDLRSSKKKLLEAYNGVVKKYTKARNAHLKQVSNKPQNVKARNKREETQLIKSFNKLAKQNKRGLDVTDERHKIQPFLSKQALNAIKTYKIENINDG